MEQILYAYLSRVIHTHMLLAFHYLFPRIVHVALRFTPFWSNEIKRNRFLPAELIAFRGTMLYTISLDPTAILILILSWGLTWTCRYLSDFPSQSYATMMSQGVFFSPRAGL